MVLIQKNLFSLHQFNIVFTLKEIKKFLDNRICNITEDVVYQSLNLFVKDEVAVYDYNNNIGTIIYRGSKEGEKYYIFQPLQTHLHKSNHYLKLFQIYLYL